MPGEGFTFDMIAHLKRNNAYLSRRRYFDAKQELTRVSKKMQIKDPKKATKEQLQKIRLVYVSRRKKRIKTRIMLMFLALIIVGILLAYGVILLRMTYHF